MKYIKNITNKDIEGIEVDYEGVHHKLDIPIGEIVPVKDNGMVKAIKDVVNKLVIKCDVNGNELTSDIVVSPEEMDDVIE